MSCRPGSCQISQPAAPETTEQVKIEKFLESIGRVSGRVGWFDFEKIFLLSPSVREVDPHAGTVVVEGIKRERARVQGRIGEIIVELRMLRAELSLKRRMALTRWSMEKDQLIRGSIMTDLDRVEENYLSAMEPLKNEMKEQKETLASLTGDLNLGDYLSKAAGSLSAIVEREMKSAGVDMAIDSSRLGTLAAAARSARTYRIPYQDEGIWLRYMDSRHTQGVTDAASALLRFNGQIYLKACRLAELPELMGPVRPVNLTSRLIIKANGVALNNLCREKK